MIFRTLNADEIECRISTISEKGLMLLLYKDARVDQNLLDETVGPLNWQKHYSRDNANCIVSIWDDGKKQWIEKEDVGKESYSEAEKGLASDSFKRACFNWGIGRELYSAPMIWIYPGDYTLNKSGKCYNKFEVDSVEYDENRKIKALRIKNVDLGKVVFIFGFENNKAKEEAEEQKAITSKPQRKNVKKEEPKESPEVEEARLRAQVIGFVNRHLKPEEIPQLCKCYKVNSLNELSAASCKHYIRFVEAGGRNINE